MTRDADFFSSAGQVVRDTSVPAHQQVLDWLLDGINSGQLGEGTKLPPERLLAQSLGVSRMTLRHSLASLEQRGKLLRKRGAEGGTYICRRKPEIDLGSLVGLAAQITRADMVASSRVISASQRKANAHVARELAIEVGDPVSEIIRVRLADGEPVCIERSFFPTLLFPEILQGQLSGSLYELLEASGHTPTTAIEYISADNAGELDAELLDIEAGRAVMTISRTALDAGGVPVEFSQDIYRSDRMSLKVSGLL